MHSDSNELIKLFINNPSDSNADSLIQAARSDRFSLNNISHLAKALANSGKIITNNKDHEIFDIPSTGGPTSLTTLICPLVLSLYNKKVLKLGVPGRPAGGIDVLAQINGYKYTLTANELNKFIEKNRYVHFLADEEFAPLDIFLFNQRKKSNSLNIPNLVIASILAKKLALGVNNVGLDIRVSSFGNFGTTNGEAIKNANKFNEVAINLGIKSKCFITNGNIPQQPYIGRGESILALNKIFNNASDYLLADHLNKCVRMALILINEPNHVIENLIVCLQNEFIENIKSQHGDFNHFNELAEKTEREHLFKILAENSGFLNINLEYIRNTITDIQNQLKTMQFPDPCGVILKHPFGSLINKGDVIATYRCQSEYIERFDLLLKKAFTVKNEYVNIKNVVIV